MIVAARIGSVGVRHAEMTRAVIKVRFGKRATSKPAFCVKNSYVNEVGG